MILYTIGYEARTQAEVFDALKGVGVALVIDVRAVAASRRPGFSKTALAGGLREVGIDYSHLRALGTPKDGRDAARKGQIARMREIYADQLATPEAALAFERALRASSQTPTALLCYEREAPCCHRAMIAERLVAKAGFTVVDL